MSSKADILGRIREALKDHAPEPGAHDTTVHHRTTAPDAFQEWLPPVGQDWEAQCQLFAQNAAMLKAEFKRVKSSAEAATEIQQIITAGKWQRVATHGHPLTDAVCAELQTSWLRTDQRYETADLEKCEGSITSCEALVAQTGSVLITSRACGGRAVSILPPHHIVVASREQLLPDLASAFVMLRKKYEGDFPSTISFITGPSRTGDIERILVLGAHGPKRLTILLVG
jgi:L-lactate dehydrogenase complex protein LldG